jgi:enoyl-CoA hydratase/carnithine racemase
MTSFIGQTISLELRDGVLELALHREPCNEIGLETLEELEQVVPLLADPSSPCLIIHSALESGFCAGADLRALYAGMQTLAIDDRVQEVRRFLERIHKVFNTIDSAPLTTIAAVHGLAFGGGLELALTCDLIIADKMARFCFPELRLGLIPGFGGIPRLKRDVGNATIRDLLLTGRSLGAQRAHQLGLISQWVGRGAALNAARSTATQLLKFDGETAQAAKRFIKPVPHAEMQQEIDIFCQLLSRPAVDAGLRRFVEDTTAHPYLP